MLRSRQNDQGGLGLWSSSPTTAEFPSVYAAHVLVEAKDRGQRIPTEVLTTLNGWLMRFAATPANSLADAPPARVCRVPPRSSGHQAGRGDLECRAGADAALSADVANRSRGRVSRLDVPADAAERRRRSDYRSSSRGRRTKRDLGEDMYYDPLVHDAQLLYLLARHFPDAPWPGAAGRARNNERRCQRRPGDSRCRRRTRSWRWMHFAKATAGTVKLSITEIGKDGRERPLTLPAGSCRK